MLEYEIKISPYTKAENTYCLFHIKNKKTNETHSSFTITKSPTGNCQLSAIGNFNVICSLFQNHIEEIIPLLKNSFKLCYYTPKLVLIDVTADYIATVEKIFSNLITHKYQYTNTNTYNKMCMFIVTFNQE